MFHIFAPIIYVIVGTLVIAGTLVGGVVLLAKWIFAANQHNINTCDCVNCKRRRAELVAKRMIEEEEGKAQPLPINRKAPTPRKDFKSAIISTIDLRQGMVVYLRDSVWRVTAITASRVGVTVHLRNIQTGQMSFNPVKRQMFDTPMWSIRPTDWWMPKRPE